MVDARQHPDDIGRELGQPDAHAVRRRAVDGPAPCLARHDADRPIRGDAMAAAGKMGVRRDPGQASERRGHFRERRQAGGVNAVIIGEQ